MFWITNKKNGYTLYTPVSLYKMGFEGVYISWTCFLDVSFLQYYKFMYYASTAASTAASFSKPSVNLELIISQNINMTILPLLLNFFAKICRKTLVRVSEACCRELLANLQCENFATLVQLLYKCHATVLRKNANTSQLSGMKIKLSDIRTNVDVSWRSYKFKWN